jgi:hypothetical protein
MKDLMNKVYK